MQLDIIDPPIERAKDLQPGDQALARSANQALTLEIVTRHPDGSYTTKLLAGNPPGEPTADDATLTAQWFNFVKIRQQGHDDWDEGLTFPDEKPESY
ncbi:hypothetical protein [Halomonas sp. WWR20]